MACWFRSADRTAAAAGFSGLSPEPAADELGTLAAAAPAASSIFAIARCAAVGSTIPGMEVSDLSATSSAVASVEVSRSGRSMPAENVTSMLSSENERSIKSPGPYPGSPHIHN